MRFCLPNESATPKILLGRCVTDVAVLNATTYEELPNGFLKKLPNLNRAMGDRWLGVPEPVRAVEAVSQGGLTEHPRQELGHGQQHALLQGRPVPADLIRRILSEAGRRFAGEPRRQNFATACKRHKWPGVPTKD